MLTFPSRKTMTESKTPIVMKEANVVDKIRAMDFFLERENHAAFAETLEVGSLVLL